MAKEDRLSHLQCEAYGVKKPISVVIGALTDEELASTFDQILQELLQEGRQCGKERDGKAMEELHCLNCGQELPEDNFMRRNALVLTDERQQVPVVLGAWCDEKCLGEWLVKQALDAMKKRVLKPSPS